MEETALIKITAIMSVPMCGWNPHWGCVAQALQPFGIPVELGYGAYWHQSIQQLMESCVNQGVDWILTLDYDSMITARHVDRLIGIMGQRPDIDAVAALQCKRGTDEIPLMTAKGQTQVQVTGDPIKVDTAHFGLTILRCDALKKMPLPWFLGSPSKEGSYGDGRLDADIYFWKEWEKTGNTVYVDPLCSIGHLQPMVAEFDADFKPIHTHVFEWRKREASR